MADDICPKPSLVTTHKVFVNGFFLTILTHPGPLFSCRGIFAFSWILHLQKKLRGVIAIAESDSVVSQTHRSQAKRFQNKTHLDIRFLGILGSRVKKNFPRFLIYQKNHAYSSASCMDTTEFYMTPFFATTSCQSIKSLWGELVFKV